MEVIFKGKREHMSNDVASLLLAAGLASQPEDKPQLIHKLTWFANGGEVKGD